MNKIAVLFSGTGTNFAYIVKHLHKREVDVVVALTDNPRAKGVAIAQKYAIPYAVIEPKNFESREVYDAVAVETLKRYKPDLTVLAGFMRILTPVFTRQIKAINLHPSLLPRHKGLHAIKRSYEDDFLEGGVSVHWVSSELDGGKIIAQKSLVKQGLTFEMYHEHIRMVEKPLLVYAIVQALRG